MSTDLITTAGEIRRTEVHPEIMRLAKQLAEKHGQVMISREASGCHLYMASPIVLKTEGVRELEKRHLAVNADRYFGLGAWRGTAGTRDLDMSAMCMKTETPYRVSVLRAMLPIQDRGFPDVVAGVEVRVKERYLVPDGNGNLVPESPGTVIPITQLPSGHPAKDYLIGRGYDLQRLEAQFHCGYCSAELPERHTVENGIPKKFYAPLPGGWKDTPQGRIIFYFMVRGAPVAWQARIIDKMIGACHFFWHPYSQTWDLVEVQVGKKPDGKPIWQLAPPFNTQPPHDWKNPAWEPSKYKTAKDAERNQMVGGLDAAVEWNKANRPPGEAIAVGCEGPLDCARIGPPGLCLAGKFLSDPQVKLICSHFQSLVWVGDDDEVGRKASLRIRAELGPRLKLHEITLPQGAKDLGELTNEQAAMLFSSYLGTPKFN